MESVLVVIDSFWLAMSKCTILRLLKEVFAITSTLQSTFKGTRNCHMEPHEFDRPRHLCSKPAQATSSESSTAQSSERPSWSQPWTAAQLLKNGESSTFFTVQQKGISNVYKCFVSNITICECILWLIVFTSIYIYGTPPKPTCLHFSLVFTVFLGIFGDLFLGIFFCFLRWC